MPCLAWADPLPTGGSVASGNVAIATPDASTMTITQGSDRAVVNWQSFNIGAGASVDIRQPSRDSAILNRVTGDTDSRIHGRLTAVGQVHVVNPNGILIGRDGVVETGGGFVASTLDISDQDFNEGRLTFGGNGASASVTNRGTVTVGQGGYAALLGGRVDNAGTITVPLGRIGLAAGERVTLDLSGDGFLQVALPSDDDGDDSALIKNSGKLSANGGRIEIKAATARNAARNAINLSGVAEARSVSVRNGAIVLGGGGGTVKVTGKVRTRSVKPRIVAPSVTVESSLRPQTRPTGGAIDITGARIALEGAQIDASGDGGGGLIRIGGDFHGQGTLPHAEFVTGDSGTLITANALNFGDGGRVVLWSDLGNAYGGQIEAQGGTEGGDGGFVEVSSKARLAFSGIVDTSAPLGTNGSLLLDPYDVTISNAADSNVFLIGTSFDPFSSPSNLNVATLETNLATTSITVRTENDSVAGTEAGDIIVVDPVSWSSTSSLTLQAFNDIDIQAAITAPIGGLTLDAGGTITTLDTGTVAVDRFRLNRGDWVQNPQTQAFLTTLPVFSATDFALRSDQASFLRVSGGTGTLADPHILADVYGLQGVDSRNLLSNHFALGGRIDATGTEFWDDFGEGFGGFNPIGEEAIAGFSGSLDGRGNTIDGLYTDQDTDDAGLFLAIDAGGSVSNLNLSNTDVSGGNVGGLAASNAGTVSTVELIGSVQGQAGQLLLGDTPIIWGGVAGGLIGRNEGTVTGSAFGGDLSGFALDRGLSAGGVVGLNLGTVSDSGALGTVDVLTNDRTATGGLVGTNGGTISDSETASSVTASIQASTQQTVSGIGGVIGVNWDTGVATASNATGQVQVTSTQNANVGGFIGENGGAVTDSVSGGNVVFQTADPIVTGSPAAGIGGFAGVNDFVESPATIGRTASYATVTVNAPGVPVNVGGHTGANEAGDILDSYALGLVTSASDQNQRVGGFAGFTVDGTIANVHASGAVRATGGFAATGGLIGLNSFGDDVTFDPTTSVTQSFWDLDTSGQVPGTRAGYGTPLNTTDFENTAAFIARADTTNWDFAAVWAPGEAGFYPAIYTIDQVLFARPDPVTLQYGTTPTAATTGSIAGGPAVYVFSPSGDTLDTSPVFTNLVFPDENVGTGQFTLATTALDSTLGLSYRVVDLPAGYEITPAPLVITANDATKTYGEEVTFAGTEFTNTPLYFADTLTSVTLTSDGAFVDASVPGGPYLIEPSAAVGTGLSNYAITYDPGGLTVDPAPATLTALDQSKTYGTTIDLGATAFTTSGFLFEDGVDTVTLTSDGAFAIANVGDSPYAITPSAPVGFGLDNYELTLIDGTLTVDPAPLSIDMSDRSKVYGDTLLFVGGEFVDYTVTGLLFDDTVTDVRVDSDGAAGSAPVAGNPYAITGDFADGTGLENYTITYNPAELTVLPSTLTITANDRTKTYGDTLTFAGTEFTTNGLLLDDSVDSVVLTSSGAAGSSPVGDGTYLITPDAASGTGLSNYDISYDAGTLFVDRAPLTIRANDQTKPFGDLFTFDGTEFTTSDLAVPGDAVDSATLSSLGAPRSALVANSPYPIDIADAVGTGLENYDITYQPGLMTVGEGAQDFIPRPPISIGFDLPNPTDTIQLTLGQPGTVPPSGIGAGAAGGTTLVAVSPALRDAERTLGTVNDIAGTLEIAATACSQSDADVTRYLACLSDALNDFANKLDEIATDLPPGMENVARIVQDARRSIDASRARATQRLAGATTAAERAAIRRDAINEARGAMETASTEIRKAISFVRADDPELASVQTQTITRVAAAVDSVGIELSRAVGL
ncbi:MBG domain-containing protein [Litorisediminicola beolgyonensis]|uniref:MBG domain-containing protein n=1 Tax=Litorisediminicola beolgyonensis TaxID=1173614 RepID=A0ABW3ZKU1_9RHOB